ncbi:glucosidase 2 subunit beta isoform X1 [Gadus chalcogrammus]|uniref:glucosidase 2 subunit beta isoform X1 n=2 Tax=Gadus chalcogrammus TaxID=1042646 RepID=UPI0024C3E375|nr:glucosidase 2 subunit beta isoform X1 [Gadus chalcogrammus]
MRNPVTKQEKSIAMASSYLLVMFLGAVTAVEVLRPRGVPLSKRQFYEENRPFTCLDGSGTIAFDRVNDDYCDCKDGSDEPGTAACPNGSFHCTNAGFRPGFIPSSRINDGICDCCDTTDEYNSGATCQNTCRELGRKERESLQMLAEVAKEGFLLKQQLIHEAKRGLDEKQSKVTELQLSKRASEDAVEALRLVKEAAEKPEKEAKDRHLKAWEEQQAVIRAEKDNTKMAEAFLRLDVDADGLVSAVELQAHTELDPDADGMFTEEEAQGVLGGVETVDTAAFETIWSSIKEKYLSEPQTDAPAPVDPPTPEETTEPASDHDSEQYPDEEVPEEYEDEDPDDEDDEDQDEEDDKIPPTAPPTETTEEDEQALPPYEEGTQSLIDVAQKARDEFDEAERALRAVDDQIKGLEKEISLDFGPSFEFAYLYGQCYDLTTSEYIYRLCPFNRVSQKPKFGGSETNLGSWGSWSGSEDNVYSQKKYDHGTGCWQGPNRSTTVKLTCGKETVVMSVSEPSRCEYLMEFTTPAVCQEPPSLDANHGHTEL